MSGYGYSNREPRLAAGRSLRLGPDRSSAPHSFFQAAITIFVSRGTWIVIEYSITMCNPTSSARNRIKSWLVSTTFQADKLL